MPFIGLVNQRRTNFSQTLFTCVARLLEYLESRRRRCLVLVRPNSKSKYVKYPHITSSEGFNENYFAAAQEFDISLDRVNWLGNIMSCIYIPATALTPWLVSRYNLRRVVRHAGSPDFPVRSICDDHFVSVRPWFHLLDSRRMDSVRWHCKVALWRQSLRAPHHRPSASRDLSRRMNRDSSLVLSESSSQAFHKRFFRCFQQHIANYGSTYGGGQLRPWLCLL